MSLENFAQEHITPEGGIRVCSPEGLAIIETEPTRVTLYNRINALATQNNRWLEREMKTNGI